MLKETGGVGCLMGNTAIELGPHDVEVANIVRAGLTQIGELLAETIRRGQEAGEIRGGTTPEDLASMLVAAAQGSAVLAKVEPGMEKSRAAIRAVLDLLRAR